MSMRALHGDDFRKLKIGIRKCSFPARAALYRTADSSSAQFLPSEFCFVEVESLLFLTFVLNDLRMPLLVENAEFLHHSVAVRHRFAAESTEVPEYSGNPRKTYEHPHGNLV